MSGIEVAGSVLSVISVLAITLEKSKKIFGSSSTSKGRHLRTMERKVQIEQTYYQNIVESFLSKVVDLDQATVMLETSDHNMWSDVTLDAGIQDFFGPDADHFYALCLALNKRLTDFQRELNQISANHSGRSKLLRFSINPKNLEQQLRDIQGIREQCYDPTDDYVDPTIIRQSWHQPPTLAWSDREPPNSATHGSRCNSRREPNAQP
ncbi:hypothetical protein FVEN_g5669 [Fusarium venenatum]|nr:hypothetical protein FVEN_g5669 [Fusarium venenatum]